MNSRSPLTRLAVNSAMAAAIGLLAIGCATQRPFSDKSISGEHQAFARCAVKKAFAVPESDLPAIEIAKSAVGQCEREKALIHYRLSEENAGKSGAASFVAGYIDEMHNTMVRQIAAQLPRIQAIRRATEKSNERLPKGSKRI